VSILGGAVEDAISFRASERMIYEVLLLNLAAEKTSDVLPSIAALLEPSTANKDRAQAFKSLANLFFLNGNIEIATAYAKRAIKLQNKASLRKGTTAETIGRSQYEEAFQAFLQGRNVVTLTDSSTDQPIADVSRGSVETQKAAGVLSAPSPVSVQPILARHLLSLVCLFASVAIVILAWYYSGKI
jgi:hypothetical protein